MCTWESTRPGRIAASPKSCVSTRTGTPSGGTTDWICPPSTNIAAGLIPPGVTTRWERKACKPPPKLDSRGRAYRVSHAFSTFRISHHWVVSSQIDTTQWWEIDRKSTRLNSSHVAISYAVFCLKKKKKYKCRFSPYSY